MGEPCGWCGGTSNVAYPPEFAGLPICADCAGRFLKRGELYSSAVIRVIRESDEGKAFEREFCETMARAYGTLFVDRDGLLRNPDGTRFCLTDRDVAEVDLLTSELNRLLAGVGAEPLAFDCGKG